MKATVNQFYSRFSEAQTVEEKKQISIEFRAFFETLNPEEKKEARTALQPFLDNVKRGFDTLDKKFNEVLRNKDTKNLKQYRSVA